jgi:hypothetical protein
MVLGSILGSAGRRQASESATGHNGLQAHPTTGISGGACRHSYAVVGTSDETVVTCVILNLKQEI